MYHLILGYLKRLPKGGRPQRATSPLHAPLPAGHSRNPAPRHNVDIRKVQELLGHRHVTTTQIYDKRRIAAAEGASHDMPI